MTPCLTGALNALERRHLAPPSNPIHHFRLVLTETQLPRLRNSYLAKLSTTHEYWRKGKGLAKLKKVDLSLAEETLEYEEVTMMIKNEYYPRSFGTNSNLKKARAIQFTKNERSAYEFADEMHAYSKALADISEEPFEMGGIQFLVVYTANMNHKQIGQFATESEAIAASYVATIRDERDGKNWDANQQVPHRKANVRVYSALDTALGAYMKRGINVKGRFSGKDESYVLYSVNGTVKSGHPDTSCGNATNNRDISVQAILSLPTHLRPCRVRALVMGDDYLAWLYFDHRVDWKELTDALNAAERKLGIHPERGLFEDIRLASFISLGFYIDTTGCVVALPKVGRMFAKLFWTVTNLSGRDPRRLASTIAHAFYPTYYTWPPMRKFLQYHMQTAPLGNAEDLLGWNYSTLELSTLENPIDWDANHVFRYGVWALDVDFGSSLEGEQFAGFLQHESFNRLYEVDMADPADREGCVGLR